MELLDGHLYVHMDLGSGGVKVLASHLKLNNGDFHRVELTLHKRIGRITINGETKPFETPGEANQLDLVGSLFVGGVDYMDPYLKLPPALWSGTLRYGFVGCLKDLFINSAPINVVKYAHQQDVGELTCKTSRFGAKDKHAEVGSCCFLGGDDMHIK